MLNIQQCLAAWFVCIYIYGKICAQDVWNKSFFFFSFLLVCQEQSEHSFKEGAKLEAVNLLSPENIHVATVTRVKGQYIWLSLEGK